MTRHQTRMKLPIPDDWMPEDGNWNIAMFCYPDSAQWRGIIRGAFYELTRGRKWDEDTGTIRTAQAIARDIMESLSMDCNTELTRIADAIEALNPDNQKISLNDLINNVASDPLGTFVQIKPLLDTMKSLQDLIPGFETKINPVDLAGLLVDAVAAYNSNRHNTEMVHLAQLRLMMEHGASFGLMADTVLNLLPGGTIADAMTDTDEYIMLTIDTIIQALTGTSTVAALIRIGDKIEAQDLSGLGDIAAIAPQITEINTSLAKLDELTNVSDKIELVHQILTQIAAIDTQDELITIADRLDAVNTSLAPLTNLTQLQYLDNIERAIRQSSCCPDMATEYVPEEWTDEPAYLDYKCRAANAVYEAVEQLFYQIKMEDWDALFSGGITVTVSLIGAMVAAYAGGTALAILSGAIIPAIALFVVFIIFGQVTLSPDDVYSSLTTNKQAIINALYNAENTDEAEASFVENMTFITDVEKMAVKTLLTKDLMSALFNDSVPSDYTPADPVVCGNNYVTCPSINTEWFAGTPQLLDGDMIQSGTIQFEASPPAGRHPIEFQTTVEHDITVTDINGHSTADASPLYVRDCNGWLSVNDVPFGGDTQFPKTYRGYGLQVRDYKSITITATPVG